MTLNCGFTTNAYLVALTDQRHPYPTRARQYASMRPGHDEPTVHGDQMWLRDGDHGVSRLLERDIALWYGEWRPVGTTPDRPLPDVTKLEAQNAAQAVDIGCLLARIQELEAQPRVAWALKGQTVEQAQADNPGMFVVHNDRIHPPVPADLEPVPGEIWQDAEGTLMCRSSTGRWWVFGVADPVDSGEPKMVHPFARVFDAKGVFVGDRLHYPAAAIAAVVAREEAQG